MKKENSGSAADPVSQTETPIVDRYRGRRLRPACRRSRQYQGRRMLSSHGQWSPQYRGRRILPTAFRRRSLLLFLSAALLISGILLAWKLYYTC